jgi:GT2 family glycosyltransferase
MDLSLVLVTYRHRDALAACLDSLPAACAGLRYEVIVVDNASGDGLVDDLARNRPDVRTIASPVNEGFARGVNRGLAIAQGRCVGLLNPDTVASPGAFTTLVGFADAHPDVGLVGPKVTDPDGGLQYSCRRFPSHWTGLFNRYSLLTRLFPNNRWSREYLMQDFDHASTLDVDWLSGACLVARRDAVERVGPLDPAFFLFNEDVDWAKRMHEAGYRVVYLPEAHVMHTVGASKGALPPWLIWRRHRGMMHYYHKHHPGPWWRMALADAGILLRCALQFAINPLRGLGKGRPVS